MIGQGVQKQGVLRYIPEELKDKMKDWYQMGIWRPANMGEYANCHESVITEAPNPTYRECSRKGGHLLQSVIGNFSEEKGQGILHGRFTPGLGIHSVFLFFFLFSFSKILFNFAVVVWY